MSKLSEKYIAGFLDADGCIEVQWKGGKYKPLLQVSFSQATPQDEVLEMIRVEHGGRMRRKEVKGNFYTELTLAGATAEKLLNRVKKHLVIKRYYADAVLSVIEKREPPEDLEAARVWIKKQRKVKSLPLPNYPPRKWLAGYFDGDGCVWTCYRKKGGHVQVATGIACAKYDTEGIEVLQKAFGGRIKPHGKNGNSVLQWILSLAPSKAKQFFEYFGKHLVVKRDQADFILACARMGNFRDGEAIHQSLKNLKAHPHRLNEPGADVANLVQGIEQIPSKLWRKTIEAQATVGVSTSA